MLFADRRSACLSLAFHAAGAWRHRPAVAQALRVGRETCCECLTRVPGWMEIHHRDDHGDWSPANLAPICAFCHLAKHPAQPGFDRNDCPLRLIWWPELTQSAVMAFAWSIVRMRSHSLQAEDAESGRINRYLQELTGELGRRESAGLKAAGSAYPADLLAAADDPPATWSGLRFFPTDVLASGPTPSEGPVLRRWLPSGMDRFPLVEILDAGPPEHLQLLRAAGGRLRAAAATAAAAGTPG